METMASGCKLFFLDCNCYLIEYSSMLLLNTKKRIGAHAIISYTDSKQLASNSRLNISSKPSHSAIWIDIVLRQWCRYPTIDIHLTYLLSMTATTNQHHATNGDIFTLVYLVWHGLASFSFYMMAILVHVWSILSSRVPSQLVNVFQCFFVISSLWQMLRIDDSALKLFVYNSKCVWWSHLHYYMTNIWQQQATFLSAGRNWKRDAWMDGSIC